MRKHNTYVANCIWTGPNKSACKGAPCTVA